MINWNREVIWMEREVFSPEEAAAYLRVHPQTVYKLLRSGELPGRKVGQLWRIPKQSLTAYLEGPATSHQRNEEKPDHGTRPGSPVTAALWRLAGCCEAPAPADLGEDHDRYLVEVWEREKGE
mgnify:CR=1 FL=1